MDPKFLPLHEVFKYWVQLNTPPAIYQVQVLTQRPRNGRIHFITVQIEESSKTSTCVCMYIMRVKMVVQLFDCNSWLRSSKIADTSSEYIYVYTYIQIYIYILCIRQLDAEAMIHVPFDVLGRASICAHVRTCVQK